VSLKAGGGATTASVPFSASVTGTSATPTFVIEGTATTITSPYAFPLGTTTVDASVTDNGGSASCTFQVTVNAMTAVTLHGMSARWTPSGVRVRWTVAPALTFAGFNVHRQTGRLRVRANVKLVPGGGRTYSFVDRHAPRAHALRYWIEAVGLDGSRSWYGPLRTGPRT
jgi:hypothetical protein